MEEKSSNSVQTAWFPLLVDRIVNLLLAGLFSIPAAIIIGILYLVHLLADERPLAPFFYSGMRLGRNRKPFPMYKIRSLQLDPEFEQGGLNPEPGAGRELKTGRFLRQSRFDELPQLWNVIRGDMNLVGPRPWRALRPAVSEQLSRDNFSYEGCFSVKPGLTGYSQFLTPSDTPVRIRFAIDNYWVAKGRHLGRDLFLVGWTIWMVLRKTTKALTRRIITRRKIFRSRGQGIEERQMLRYRSRHIWIQLTDVDFSDRDQPMIKIYDINPRAVSFISSRELQPKEMLYFYLVGCKECETEFRKKARCGGYVYKSYPAKCGTRYVVFYEPLSPRHRYLIDHYVLHETVA